MAPRGSQTSPLGTSGGGPELSPWHLGGPRTLVLFFFTLEDTLLKVYTLTRPRLDNLCMPFFAVTKGLTSPCFKKRPCYNQVNHLRLPLGGCNAQPMHVCHALWFIPGQGFVLISHAFAILLSPPYMPFTSSKSHHPLPKDACWWPFRIKGKFSLVVSPHICLGTETNCFRL